MLLSVPLQWMAMFFIIWCHHRDSTTTVTNKGTVKQVNYDVKTDTTSVVEKASDSVVGVVVYKNTTCTLFAPSITWWFVII